MTETTAGPVEPTVPYTVIDVAGHVPVVLNDFIGATTVSVTSDDQEYRLRGAGRREDPALGSTRRNPQPRTPTPRYGRSSNCACNEYRFSAPSAVSVTGAPTARCPLRGRPRPGEPRTPVGRSTPRPGRVPHPVRTAPDRPCRI